MNIVKAFVIGVGGYGFGYYIGVLNPVGNPYLGKVLDVPESDLNDKLGNANLAFSIGAMASTLIMGPISNRLGRINLLMLCEAITLICCAWYALPNIYSFYAVRFVTGMAVSVNQAMSPVVLTETFPSKISGPMGMVVYISLTGFILGSYSPAWIFTDDEIAKYYIYIFAFPGIVALSRLILIFVLFYKIQTPIHIITQAGSLIEDTRSAFYQKLIRVLGTVYVQEDVPKVARDLILANKERLMSGNANIKVKDLFGRRYRNAFAVAVLLNVF